MSDDKTNQVEPTDQGRVPQTSDGAQGESGRDLSVRPKCPECGKSHLKYDSFDLTNVFCVWCGECGHVFGVGYGPAEAGCPPIPVNIKQTETALVLQQPVNVKLF